MSGLAALAVLLLAPLGSTTVGARTVPAAPLPPALGPSNPQPEARPFNNPKQASQSLDAALQRARANGRRVLAVFGTNDCHDSRALAGWFATPPFAAMLGDRYEVVWIDVGHKSKNLDLARRFGLDGIVGTPTLLMLEASGTALNLADAPTWRNAASRDEDAIYQALADPR